MNSFQCLPCFYAVFMVFSVSGCNSYSEPRTTTTPKPNISSSTIDTSLVKVGQESKITCVTRFPIIQHFPYDNQSIIYPLCRSASNNNECTLTFNTWEEFDINSSLTSSCYRKSTHMRGIKKSVPNTTMNITRYTSDTLVYFDCSYYRIDYSRYVNVTLIRNKTLKIFLKDRVNMTFTMQDNGSILSCYVFVDKDTEGTRYFYNKTMLIYQENNDYLTEYKDWFIGVGAVVVLIIIIIIISLTIKINKKKSRLISPLQSEPKEATKTDPDRALYANMDMTAIQQYDQNPTVQESQYATIMSPDRVLYAELDLQNSNRRPEIIDSPYAEVIVSSVRGQHIKR